MNEERLKIGPFICEFCDTIMTSLKARSAVKDGKVKAVGYCRSCGCDTWTKEVLVPEEVL